MNAAGDAGAAGAKKITLSWTTMLRVVKTQILIRGLSKLISTFIEAQKAAADFSVSIGEISTISTGALGSIDQISSSVLELSRSLGLAADEVAEGLYQTLSNQVVDAADALRFEEQAAKLSIATHSKLKESVNALSSVINSYGLDVSEVGHVSDILFKTIELGRLRMGEFGDVLGRLTPLTATLGISFEEMSASLAALTQKGIPAHTAITQLTQVSQKLLRPTAKLQELYKQWGVDTGPEAIRRFGGLTGVLLKMKDASAGNDAEFSNLLGRVRALVGGLNLTSDGASAVTEALDMMADAAGDNIEAFEEVESTIGRKAVKSWNDLKVSVLQFGEAMLHITVPITDALGFLVRNFDLVAIAMAGVAAGLLIMSGAVASAALSVPALAVGVAALQASLLTLWPIAIAVGVALATAFAVKGIQASLNKSAALTDKYKKQLEDLTKAQETSSRRMIEATEKEFQARRKITGEYFSNLTRDYRKTFEQFEISSKAVGKVLDNTLSEISSKKQKVLSEIRAAVFDTDSVIKDSAKEVAATQEAIGETSFKRSLKRMNTRQQLWAKVTRAQDKASEASKAYGEAGASEEAVKQARSLSYVAEKQAKEALAHAMETKNYGAIKKAENALDKIRADRLRAEISFQEERKNLQTDAHKLRLKQLEEYGVKAEEIGKKIQALLDPITDGKIKTELQLADDIARAAELMPDLKAALEGAFDVDLFESLNVAKTMAALEEGVTAAFSKADFDYSRSLAKFETQLSARTYSAPVKLRIVNQDIIDRYIEQFGEIDLRLDAGKTQSQMQKIAEDIVKEFEASQRAIDTGTQNITTLLDQAAERVSDEQFRTWWSDLSDSAKDAFKTIEEGYLTATGASEKSLAAARAELTAEQQLQAMVRSGIAGIKEATAAGRELTASEKDRINAILTTGKAYEEAGLLSQNAVNQTVAAYLSLVKAAGLSGEVAAEALAQLELGPGAYSDSLKLIQEQADAAKEGAESQAEITAEAGKTTGELGKSKQAAIELPGAAAKGTEALANETEQAKGLKHELQGATQAQLDMNEALSQQDGGAAGTEPAVPLEKTKEELEAQAQAARQLTQELLAVDAQFGVVIQSIEGMSLAMEGTSEITTLIAGSLDQTVLAAGTMRTSFETITQQISLSIAAMDLLGLSTADTLLNIEAANTATINWTTNLHSVATAGYAVAASMQAAAAAAVAAARAIAAVAAASGGASAAYYGGPAIRYRQSGGFAPRGKDRIPVMASAGEFFVNSRSARRFSSELQAMNAGSEPTYRDRGGPVTNVGDINVSVTQGEAANQTARQIATALRRELRRGTSRLD
jgi:TP901 family phage tail tape measure protein